MTRTRVVVGMSEGVWSKRIIRFLSDYLYLASAR
jgi:hypothetical protein